MMPVAMIRACLPDTLTQETNRSGESVFLNTGLDLAPPLGGETRTQLLEMARTFTMSASTRTGRRHGPGRIYRRRGGRRSRRRAHNVNHEGALPGRRRTQTLHVRRLSYDELHDFHGFFPCPSGPKVRM
jgi:hypothetical protein